MQHDEAKYWLPEKTRTVKLIQQNKGKGNVSSRSDDTALSAFNILFQEFFDAAIVFRCTVFTQP